MTILSNIKKHSLKLFFNYHPKINSLKKESKKLQNMHNNKLTLCECQEIVAKNNGFEDWQHFMRVMEKSFTQLKIDKSLHLTNSPISDKTEHLILGFEMEYQKYLWSNQKDFFNNIIIGEDLNGSYDLFLMAQMIEKKSPIYYINPPSISQIENIVEYAKSLGLEKNIRVFDFSETNIFPQYQQKIYNVLEEIIDINKDLPFIEDVLKEGFSLYHNTSGVWESRFFLLYSCVICMLKDLLASHNFNFNINTIKKALQFDNIIKIYEKIDSLPGNIQTVLKNYMETLPGFNENIKEATEQHNYLITHFNLFVDNFIGNKIFEKGGIPLFKLFETDPNNCNPINIFYFGNTGKSQYYQTLVLFLLNHEMRNLNFVPQKNLKYRVHSRKHIIMNDCFLPFNLLSFTSMARGTGMSLIYSYKNTTNFKNKNNSHNIKLLMASIFNLFISPKELKEFSNYFAMKEFKIGKDFLSDYFIFSKSGKFYLLRKKK